jgi:ABC-type transporter Mla subunit MlaD
MKPSNKFNNKLSTKSAKVAQEPKEPTQESKEPKPNDNELKSERLAKLLETESKLAKELEESKSKELSSLLALLTASENILFEDSTEADYKATGINQSDPNKIDKATELSRKTMKTLRGSFKRQGRSFVVDIESIYAKTNSLKAELEKAEEAEKEEIAKRQRERDVNSLKAVYGNFDEAKLKPSVEELFISLIEFIDPTKQKSDDLNRLFQKFAILSAKGKSKGNKGSKRGVVSVSRLLDGVRYKQDKQTGLWLLAESFAKNSTKVLSDFRESLDSLINNQKQSLIKERDSLQEKAVKLIESGEMTEAVKVSSQIAELSSQLDSFQPIGDGSMCWSSPQLDELAKN